RGDLPAVLAAPGVVADEAIADGLARAHPRLAITLEAGLAPADRAVGSFHPHEHPAGRDHEGFDAVDRQFRERHRAYSAFCWDCWVSFRPALAASPLAGGQHSWSSGLIGTASHTDEAGSTSRQSRMRFL